MDKQQKKLIWALVVLAVIAIAGGLFNLWRAHKNNIASKVQNNQVQSHQIFGQITSITGSQIVVSGMHVLDVNPGNSDYKNRKAITVNIDSNTKLVKTIWHVHRSTGATNTFVKIDPDSIKKDQQTGSVDDFKNTTGQAITVKTAGNTINDTTVSATEIDYITIVFDK